jgi:hypothetical protein
MLPPLPANTGFVRFVHVSSDGSETDYADRPDDVPTIKVTVVKSLKHCIVEETVTKNAGHFPTKPAGTDWEEVPRRKRSDTTRWRRRRAWERLR